MKRHNLSNKFRQRRMQRFVERVEPLRDKHLRILDVGGTAAFWRALPGLYKAPDVEVTIVNLGSSEHEDGNLVIRDGDALNLPFEDGSFDVVHSNSVIEHVGHWHEMEKMAGELRRLAPNYSVQTPNMWFPVEPHFKLPFVHWLPEQTRACLVEALGRSPKTSNAAEATLAVQRISLLSAAQLQCLFPDAQIWREKVLGFTKSLVAEKFVYPSRLQ